MDIYKQRFTILILAMVLGTILIGIFLITQTNAKMTIHLTSDDNTLEIIKEINITGILDTYEGSQEVNEVYTYQKPIKVM
jgi:hypothetical protein